MATVEQIVLEQVVLSDYAVQISEDVGDPVWDAFVASIPGGHHVQTSLWGQVKGVQGWKAVRVVATREGVVMGGLQLLMRPISFIGELAYVTKGPLCSTDDPALLTLILDTLSQICRMNQVQYLIVQPAKDYDWITDHLTQRGFRATVVEVAPTATILLDLSQSHDDLLKQMQGQRRRGIQRSLREKFTVREGTEADLDTFYKLHLATSQRHHFDPFPFEYFVQMWKVLRLNGYISMVLSECQGEAISGLLLITFGDTATFKVFGWSGLHGSRRPNEAAFWGAIQWAKEHGFRYFDFEGVDFITARAVLNNQPFPEALRHTPTFFKFAYGGQITLSPLAYDYVFNPLLRLAFRAISPVIQHRAMLYMIAERLRKR